jgi:hypothetical protein
MFYDAGGFGDIKPVVISADEFAAITGGLTDGVSIRLLGEVSCFLLRPKNFFAFNFKKSDQVRPGNIKFRFYLY